TACMLCRELRRQTCWSIATIRRQLRLHGLRDEIQTLPTILAAPDLTQLPMTFTQSQTKHQLHLRADLSAFSSTRFNRANTNRVVGERPTAHRLNDLASLFLTEIGACLKRAYDHKQEKSHPQITPITQKIICVICGWLGGGPSHHYSAVFLPINICNMI